jgi:hypothetical protein
MVTDADIERRQAATRRVFEAQKTFRPFSNYASGECWVHPATLKAKYGSASLTRRAFCTTSRPASAYRKCRIRRSD